VILLETNDNARVIKAQNPKKPKATTPFSLNNGLGVES
jgi:hypothetical protein